MGFSIFFCGSRKIYRWWLQEIIKKINKQKEQNPQGWQPYSYVKTNDGRYISLNRLDPIFTPFFIAADMYDN